MTDQNFELLDLIGFDNIFDYNPKYNIIAYSSGFIINIFFINEDIKKHVFYHESPVTCLKFSLCGDFLFSIDKTLSSSIVIWEVPTMRILYQSFLPVSSSIEQGVLSNINKFIRETNNFNNFNNKTFNTNQNKVEVKNIFIDFFPTTSSKFKFVIVINYSTKQQSFMLMEYSIMKNIVDLVLETTAEVEALCQGLVTFKKQMNNIKYESNEREKDDSFITKKQEYCFVTIEDLHVKVWKVDEFCIKVITKIQTKQRIIPRSIAICESLKLICIITEGSSIIFDYKGSFLISFSCEYINDQYKKSSSSSGIFSLCIFLLALH